MVSTLKLFPSTDLLDDLFDTFDTERRGTLTYENIAIALCLLSKGTADEKLTFLFNLHDKKRKGVIGLDEISVIISQIRKTAAQLGRKGSGKAMDEFKRRLLEIPDVQQYSEVKKSEWIYEGKKRLVDMLAGGDYSSRNSSKEVKKTKIVKMSELK
uniref:EF-hand domain-containing protein n=1 Tax=Arcella intermedia TaxID=1963864 RepID=A0A6B2LJJ0_9EUKA